jgi:prepilin-type N-terminal cleavage/methylation domain-containing protein/prepilin-type processing-associated H-X9-DG protein
MSGIFSAHSVYQAPGPDNFRNRPRGRFGIYGGFTLIELLVVVAVIAILAAILFPVFASSKEKARQVNCLSNLKQISSAWQLYADNYSGRACPAFYSAEDESADYSWDFTYDRTMTPAGYRLGLLGPYTKSQAINKCPSFTGKTWGRPYTGYAYNTTYIGGIAGRTLPCLTAGIAHPSATVVFVDAGYYQGNTVLAHNYLRAPSDALFSAGTAHFRHNGQACVAYADGHVGSASHKYRYDSKKPECGALSEDDSAYDLK